MNRLTHTRKGEPRKCWTFYCDSIQRLFQGKARGAIHCHHLESFQPSVSVFPGNKALA